MTLVEYFLLFALFFTGFVFMTAFCGHERPLRSLAGAFPMGCCLWAAGTFLAAACPLLPKDAYGLSLPGTAVFMGIVATVALLVTLRHHGYTKKYAVAFFCAFFLCGLAYWFFTNLNISILTGDSPKHIHPSAGLFTALKNDVRSFNQTLAALAGLSGQDRYFFAYHSLFAVSLIVLLAECIYHEVNEAGSGLIPALSTALAGSLLLASCHITALNAFYVNNHLLIAVLIMLALSIFLGRTDREPAISLPMAYLGVIVVSFLPILRLEGQLIALLLLLVMLGRPGISRKIQVRGFALFALLTAPILLFMILYPAHAGSKGLSPWIFPMIMLCTALLPLFFMLNARRWVRYVQEHANILTLLGLVLAIALFILISPDRMQYRMGFVLHNSLDESYWGFVHQALALAIIAIFALRILFPSQVLKSVYQRTDLALLFYLGSLLLIIFMLNFHGSRLGWSDSQNRMLFQCLPVGILWVSIQAGLGFAGGQKES
jgi:hypothetical protein